MGQITKHRTSRGWLWWWMFTCVRLY